MYYCKAFRNVCSWKVHKSLWNTKIKRHTISNNYKRKIAHNPNRIYDQWNHLVTKREKIEHPFPKLFGLGLISNKITRSINKRWLSSISLKDNNRLRTSKQKYIHLFADSNTIHSLQSIWRIILIAITYQVWVKRMTFTILHVNVE